MDREGNAKNEFYFKTTRVMRLGEQMIHDNQARQLIPVHPNGYS